MFDTHHFLGNHPKNSPLNIFWGEFLGIAQTKNVVSIIIMHIIRVFLLYKMSLIINNVHYNIPQTLRCFQMSLNWINMGKPLDIKSTIIYDKGNLAIWDGRKAFGKITFPHIMNQLSK